MSFFFYPPLSQEFKRALKKFPSIDCSDPELITGGAEDSQLSQLPAGLPDQPQRTGGQRTGKGRNVGGRCNEANMGYSE